MTSTERRLITVALIICSRSKQSLLRLCAFYVKKNSADVSSLSGCVQRSIALKKIQTLHVIHLSCEATVTLRVTALRIQTYLLRLKGFS
jgi:hypothetical protein